MSPNQSSKYQNIIFLILYLCHFFLHIFINHLNHHLLIVFLPILNFTLFLKWRHCIYYFYFIYNVYHIHIPIYQFYNLLKDNMGGFFLFLYPFICSRKLYLYLIISIMVINHIILFFTWKFAFIYNIIILYPLSLTLFMDNSL